MLASGIALNPLFTAKIAELKLAPASHVVAAIIFLNPKLALRALLHLPLLRQLLKLIILLEVCVGDLVLLTSLARVRLFTLQAVIDLADRARKAATFAFSSGVQDHGAVDGRAAV